MNEQEFWSILHDIPETKPVFYRLYYNDNGDPIVYTMDDLPGKYIDVDQATYTLASYNVQVVDGKLIEIIPKVTTRKLTPGSGTPCAPDDVSIIVEPHASHVKWSLKDYETN